MEASTAFLSVKLG